MGQDLRSWRLYKMVSGTGGTHGLTGGREDTGGSRGRALAWDEVGVKGRSWEGM